jgi:hypothetical protein
MSVSLHRLHASFAILVILEALLRRIVNSALAGDDLLDGGENAAPVFEDGERHVFACAVGDEVWRVLAWSVVRVAYEEEGFHLPWPFLAKRRSVSRAADRSETPSPA